MNPVRTILLIGWSLSLGTFLVGATPPRADLRTHLQPAVFALTRVMMHDVVNPPAASRFYSYCLLGAHEIVAQGNARVVSPRSLLRVVPELTGTGTDDYPVAALYCILETGRLLLPSGALLEEDQRKLRAQLRREGYPEARIGRAVAVAQAVAQQVLAYAAADGYRNLSARLRYRPTRRDGAWYPTPPGYIEAVEPHWKTIRPMLIDSCGQFVPPPPVAFRSDSGSAFRDLMREVYQTSQSLTPEQRLIASYWDCNPFAINTAGHMAIGFKKISPGGHWMNIASQVAQQAQLPFDQAVVVHSITALTLMDAFIGCWDEKYRSNRVRPETVINRYLDAHWQPLLQTPPFPEYPSGHSVVSTAVAEVLTYLLGDDFAFTDTTEMWFELPSRRFSSFRQAAAEASISRLYGGIHFRDAIEHGQRQGWALGTFVVARLRAVGIRPSGPAGSGRK